jgi:hypothetical protein
MLLSDEECSTFTLVTDILRQTLSCAPLTILSILAVDPGKGGRCTEARGWLSIQTLGSTSFRLTMTIRDMTEGDPRAML